MWRPKIRNRAFDRMGEEYARVIDPNHFLGRSAFDVPYKKLPPVNIVKNGALFEMEVFVPGFKKEELEITVSDDILTIRGEKAVSRKKEENDKEYVLEEFDFDSFERKFKLAKAIGKEKIDARFDNGILRLTFIDVPEEEEQTHKTVAVQ